MFEYFPGNYWWSLLLAPCAVAATVAVQIVILEEQHYMHWFISVLIGVAVLGVCLMALRRLAALGMAIALCALLIAPSVYAATTWLAPVEGTFPAAGPHVRRVGGHEGHGIRLSAYVDNSL